VAEADDRCPRCGGRFHCGANDAKPCACNTIHLDAPTLDALRASYSVCLCLRCLTELEAGAPLDREPSSGP
jgi:hypothetical protein